jgi:hypothetical protein
MKFSNSFQQPSASSLQLTELVSSLNTWGKKKKAQSVLFPPFLTFFLFFHNQAPRAKLLAQRQRRFKPMTKKSGFDTRQLTPGTTFMVALGEALYAYAHSSLESSQVCGTPLQKQLSLSPFLIFCCSFLFFSDKRTTKNFLKKKELEIIVSSSEREGEGEHKIFEHIRSVPTEENGKFLVIGGYAVTLFWPCCLC